MWSLLRCKFYHGNRQEFHPHWESILTILLVHRSLLIEFSYLIYQKVLYHSRVISLSSQKNRPLKQSFRCHAFQDLLDFGQREQHTIYKHHTHTTHSGKTLRILNSIWFLCIRHRMHSLHCIRQVLPSFFSGDDLSYKSHYLGDHTLNI